MQITVRMTRMLLTATLTFGGVGLVSLPASAQDAKRGEEVYTAQKCSVCHSIAGKGNKMNPLDGIGAKLSAADIKQWIVNPTDMTAKSKSTKKPPMPNKF